MNDLATNYNNVLNMIQRSSLEPNHPIALVAVSKHCTDVEIAQLYKLGQLDFAENYVDELSNKAQTLKHLNINWHFIGNIQSNKLKPIAKYASWVQSLEKPSHVIKLNNLRDQGLPPLNVLIEIKISGDVNKHGLTANLEEITKLADIVVAQPKLKLRGIMAMASLSDNQTLLLNEFTQLRMIFEKLKQQGYDIDTLSMGTSSDYNLAITAGATMVRVGSALFKD